MVEKAMIFQDSEHNCSKLALEWIRDYDDPKTQLQVVTDLESTLASFGLPWKPPFDGMIKMIEDMNRYQQIIFDTEPDVIVECGTAVGGAAEWYSLHGLDVITIDVGSFVSSDRKLRCGNRVKWLVCDSIDNSCYDRVKSFVNGRRCMLSIDSDHNACHVLAEIELYHNFVSPGCYMVVEDGIFRWKPENKDKRWPGEHGPLLAIEAFLSKNSDFVRDEEIETIYPITMNPGGWLRRMQ